MEKQFTLDMQKKYLRIPFKDHGQDFCGCDCGGLLRLIYKEELGIILPDWSKMYTSTSRKNANILNIVLCTMLGDNGCAVPIGDAKPFDVLEIAIASTPMHVGIVVGNNNFIHISQGRAGVEIRKYTSNEWVKRVIGAHRHEKMF